MGVRPVGAAHFGDGRSGHPAAHTRGRAPGGVVGLRYSGRCLGATRRGVTLRLRPCERRPGSDCGGSVLGLGGPIGGLAGSELRAATGPASRRSWPDAPDHEGWVHLALVQPAGELQYRVVAGRCGRPGHTLRLRHDERLYGSSWTLRTDEGIPVSQDRGGHCPSLASARMVPAIG